MTSVSREIFVVLIFSQSEKWNVLEPFEEENLFLPNPVLSNSY